jgi:hypothetical protein
MHSRSCRSVVSWDSSRSLAALVVFATAALGQPGRTPSEGTDRVIGTWTLDLERSTYSPGPPPKSQTRTYEVDPKGVKATIVTVDAKGRSTTAQYVADYDSIEYPFTGSAQVDAISLKRVNASTAEATLMHARKIIGTARRVISDDGKTMTITFKGTDEQGRALANVAVYVKKDGS